MTSRSYESLPYLSTAWPDTHPDRIAAIGTLCGLNPPDVRTSRILEIGGGDGGNLISIAHSLPNATAIGIELGEKHVQIGNELANEVGLENIELRQGDLLDIDESLGRFDYIISHGVYSWVPDFVREKLVQICAENLSENGIAYISYNVYPGWLFRRVAREMMSYHAGHIEDPLARTKEGLAFLDTVQKSLPEEQRDTAFDHYLREEQKALHQRPHHYVFHDLLEEHNNPVYFHEFAQHVDSHDLQVLGDTDLRYQSEQYLPQEVVQSINKLDFVQKQQYFDFFFRRSFRKSLICHKTELWNENIPPLDALKQLHLAGQFFRTESTSDAGDVTHYSTPGGTEFDAQGAAMRNVLQRLGDSFPSTVPGNTLLALADSPAEQNQIAQILHSLIVHAAIFINTHEREYLRTISPAPIASRLAQSQSTRSDHVTTAHHLSTKFDPISRRLIQMMDGSRDYEALVQVCVDFTDQKGVELEGENGFVKTRDDKTALLRERIRPALENFAMNGLLVG